MCPAVTDLDIRRRRWKAEPQSQGGARCCPGSCSSPLTHSDGPVHNSRKGLWWGTAVGYGQHRNFCSVSLNIAASSLLLPSSEHDFHVTTCSQARQEDAAEICLIHCPVQIVKSAFICVGACRHTHYDTILSNMNVGTDLSRIDHTVLLDEDVISDVQGEKCHSGGWDRRVSDRRHLMQC